MKAIIIGLGSMGKRRIRLLQANFSDIVIIGIDQNIERSKEVGHEFNIKTSCFIQEILSTEKINYAFVCTAPLSHAGIISLCLENNINVFTELNLVSDGYRENISLAEEKTYSFLSSTFL